MRTITTLAVAVAVPAIAARAQATPILTIPFLSTPSSSTEDTGVSASVAFDLSSGPTGALLTLTITNTTPVTVGALLTAVGFEWPGIASLTDAGSGGYFDQLHYNVGVSPGWMSPPGGYDLMLTSDGRFEGGNPQGAPAAGESHTVVLDLGQVSLTAAEVRQAYELHLASAPGPLAIARFQSVGLNGELSDKVASYTVVPEPTMLCMLVFGALLGRSRRH